MEQTEQILTKTIAMPADTNPNGDIFGGWLLSQMDVAGGILARSIANGRVATVAIKAMKFLKPVKIGDTVSCFGVVTSTGNTSITIRLRVEAESWNSGEKKEVTTGVFVYVAIDLDGKPRSIA